MSVAISSMIFLSFIAFRTYKETKDLLRSILTSIMIYITSFAFIASLLDMKAALISMGTLALASGIYIMVVEYPPRRFIPSLIAAGTMIALHRLLGVERAIVAAAFYTIMEVLQVGYSVSISLSLLFALSVVGYSWASIPLYLGVGWIGNSRFRKILKEDQLLRRTEWVTLLHAGVFSLISYIVSLYSEIAGIISMFLFVYMAALYAIKSLERERTASRVELVDASKRLEDIINNILSFDPSSSLDEYLNQILESASKLINGVEAGSIELYDRGVYRYKAALNFDLEKLKKVYFTEDEMYKYDSPKIIRHNSDYEESLMERKKLKKVSDAISLDISSNIKVTMVCPLTVKKKFYGAIFLDNFTDENVFTEKDIKTLEIFGKLASLFLEMKVREEEIEAMSKRLGLLVKLGGEWLLSGDRSSVYWKAYEMVKELYGDVLNLFVWTEPHEGMWTGVAIDRYGNTIPLNVPEGEGVMYEVMTEGKTKVVHDVSKNPKFYEIIPGTGSMIGIPIHYKGSFFGGLDIEVTQKNYFKEEDVMFFEELANALGLIFKYYENVEKVENLYYSVIKSLASAVDMKDPYTYGHSERVAYYSMGIGKAMGLNEKQLNNLKYGATLHDIGKIGIPHDILNKRGKLSEEEMNIIKSHTILGYATVKDIPDFKDVAAIIKWHHERWDGLGYPDGLKGEQIPLEARIIAVADTFDAMTSDRPYRKMLPVEVAIEEIRKNSGSQFDPKVVKVAVEILENLWLEYRKEHAEKSGMIAI